MKPKSDSLLLQISKCWKIDQVSRSRLFVELPLRDWMLCVSALHFRKPPRNVDKNATRLSSCDPQHLPLWIPPSHFLFLIRSAFRVECFYVDVKRQILKILITKFTLEGDITFWGTVLLSNMEMQIVSVFCGEIGTLGKMQCSKWTSLLVTCKVKLCSLGTTIVTSTFSFQLSEVISIKGVWQSSLE